MSGHVFRSNLFALLQRHNSNLYMLNENTVLDLVSVSVSKFMYILPYEALHTIE